MASIKFAEVQKHSTPDDLWVVVHGKVYDLSKFLHEHPGGVDALIPLAGKDATKSFEVVHPKDMLDLLPADCFKGPLDAADVQKLQQQHADSKQDLDLPSIDQMLNVFDFEAVASRVMSKSGWAYYSSGADDEITLRENMLAFQRIWLRPRVLVNVAQVDTSSKILGHNTSFPLYITATALGKLAHPEGEVVLTRAAAEKGIVQMIPTLASCSMDEIVGARAPGQIQFFQLYVNSDRKLTRSLVEKAERLGCKALCLTVDAPELGRREKDMRVKFDAAAPSVTKGKKIKRAQGTAKAIGSFIDPSLCWDDLKWFQSITKMPIVLKGIQCAEDAIRAVEHGCAGIILSNHGGRQLDFARSGIEVLVEVMDALRANGMQDRIEVWIDGGIRRGTDIFKALALGARAVGIGRPTLYGLAAYGQPGVERVLEMFQNELEVAMKLMGTRSIQDISRSHVVVRNISDHSVNVPRHNLLRHVYQPMTTPSVTAKSKL